MVPIHICKTLSSCHLCTAPSLPPVPRWVAREAGQAGRSCRAGGARAAGPAGQSSRAAHFVAREGGPAGQKIQLTSFVLTCFPHLSQSQRILPFCPHFTIYLIFILLILYPFLSSNWVLVPPPSHRQEGMVLGDSLEVLRTQCWYPPASPCDSE